MKSKSFFYPIGLIAIASLIFLGAGCLNKEKVEPGQAGEEAAEEEIVNEEGAGKEILPREKYIEAWVDYLCTRGVFCGGKTLTSEEAVRVQAEIARRYGMAKSTDIDLLAASKLAAGLDLDATSEAITKAKEKCGCEE